MKQFSHDSVGYGFTSLVQLTKNVMTIQVSELDPVDFFSQDLFETLKNIDCPAAAGAIFNLADTPNWDVELDDRKVFNLVHDHFVANDMPQVADRLLERKVQILGIGMPTLRQQWKDGLCEDLTRFATRLGGASTAADEADLDLVFRKANPGLFRKAKHLKARQFIETEWPIVYSKARSMIS